MWSGDLSDLSDLGDLGVLYGLGGMYEPGQITHRSHGCFSWLQRFSEVSLLLRMNRGNGDLIGLSLHNACYYAQSGSIC